MALLPLFTVCTAQPTGWYFLPCGAKPRAEIARLTPAEFAKQVRAAPLPSAIPDRQSSARPEYASWRPARFPHAEFDRTQPQSKVYGWYGTIVNVPASITGRDLVLDLGVIDDADIAYANGAEVGRSGSLDDASKSKWCRDRRYRIPAKLVRPGPNPVLVQVKDFRGLGGMVGPPVIGAALVAADGKWDFLNLGVRGKTWIKVEGLNRAKRLPRLPSTEWETAPIPDTGWDAREKRADCYGAYRLRFTMSPERARALAAESAAGGARAFPGPVLDLGPVFDAAAVYLNGARIAQCGRFPEAERPAFVETAERLRFFVPPRLLRAGEDANELTVLVFNTVQRGGLPGIPMWVWRTDGTPTTWQPAVGGGKGVPEFPADRFAESALSSADLFAQSGDAGRARHILAAAAKHAHISPPAAARLISGLAFLDLRMWEEAPRRGPESGAKSGAGASEHLLRRGLNSVRRLLHDYPVESVSQDAMQAFCSILRRAESDRELRKVVVEFFPKLNLESTGFPGGRASPRAVRSGGRASPRAVRSGGRASPRAVRSGGRASPRAAVGATSVAANIKRKVAQPSRLPIASGTLAPLSCTPRPPSPRRPGPVRYLGPDRTTRGDWLFEYGREFYSLSAMGGRGAWPGGRRSVALSTGIPGKRDVARCWLPSWLRRTALAGALLMPGPAGDALAALPAFRVADFAGPVLPDKQVRRAAWLDDHGEQHAFDEQGPDLLVHVAVPPGSHLLAFYAFDQDWQYTWHPRQQSVLLFDDRGRLLNGAWTGKFGGGVYERFLVHGPLDLTTRFFKHRSACVALSGVFLDELPADEGAGATTTTVRPCPPENSLPPANRALLHRLLEFRRHGGTVEANRLLIDRLRQSKDAPGTAQLCMTLARPGIDWPARWAHLAAGRFFELEPALSDAAAEPLLRGLLRTVFAHRFRAIRLRALSAWLRRGLEPDAAVRHATRRLGVSLAEGPPGAPTRESSGEKI